MRTTIRFVTLITLGSLLGGSERSASAADPERLFLQQVGSETAIVKWRGDSDQVCWAKKLGDLSKETWPRCVAATPTAGGHKEGRITDLAPDQTYFYILGAPGPGAGTIEQTFTTAPDTNKPPKDGNVHIWLIGDSGTATEVGLFDGLPTHPGEAEEVKQGFLAYNADKEPVDLFVLLGDNAYLEGTDEQWQGAFFDVYPEVMNKAAVWPTIGNHEMGGTCFDLGPIIPLPFPLVVFLGGTSNSSDPLSYDGDSNCVGGVPVPGPDGSGPPYLDIFSLPSAGELGGVPSGTEQYYSMDYGNVHLVSLDAQLSNVDADQREAMRQWLIADLSSNVRDWTIVIFHHPPYSKGENHDSDLEQREIDMRVHFTPVFEDYGVDVVFSGHSHSYERSYYLNGHSGPSNTFDPALHAELDEAGEPATGQGAEEYSQVSVGSGADDKAVYTVAGSSGKVDELDPCLPGQILGCTPPDWLQHPAHFFSIAVKGSVVVDATTTSLTSRFIDANGDVVDSFTINR